MTSPKNTYISIDNAKIEITSNPKELTGVRIYKDTPDTVLLQIFGKRANTKCYGMARMNKDQLRQLINASLDLMDHL